jgi:glucose-6-phosphate isomerase
MLPRINPTTTQAWSALEQHVQKLKSTHLRDLFQQDPERFQKYSFRFEDILVDVF